jgi:NAD(P)H-quinone oxidoreductase subunit 6
MVLITPWQISTTSPAVIDNTMVALGKHFFSDFLLPFELASILLLIAMIGAIVLARRDFIPDISVKSSELTSTALTLPERPRELTNTGK